MMDARCWLNTSSPWPLGLTEGRVLLCLRELPTAGTVLHITRILLLPFRISFLCFSTGAFWAPPK